MVNGIFQIRKPANEPVLAYAPESRERKKLQKILKNMRENPVEVPCIIAGREVRTGDLVEIKAPHNHHQILGCYHSAGTREAKTAIEAALEGRKVWEDLDWTVRARIMLKAAELLAGKYRQTVNAATMLSQSKTCHQAEIDAACELIDFWRFNPYLMTEIYACQPTSLQETFNCLEYRPLEGFVFAISPFNFTSIAGNLCTAPALMGNTVVWKPASPTSLPAYYLMRILQEAGMPDGVINMLPGPGPVLGPPVLNHPDLSGVHFTGSTEVFSSIFRTIGMDIRRYHSYPRIVGETGGKDFVFAHPSANVDALVAAILRGGFEYQGQKCSAASRVYVPDNIWAQVRECLLDEVATIKVGDVCDFSNFMGAVIDRKAFNKISEYIEHARKDDELTILCGGVYNDSEGYFIQPTVVESKSPNSRLMSEEIFGPVVTVYVYPEKEYEKTLRLCDTTSPYALTGSIFAQDRSAIETAVAALRHAAGNFYINDKPTAAVVGQQPFGGSRASGTNDKAGSRLNLERWTSPRAIKETFLPPNDYRYPFMK